jgi:hypothetical protein
MDRPGRPAERCRGGQRWLTPHEPLKRPHRHRTVVTNTAVVAVSIEDRRVFDGGGDRVQGALHQLSPPVLLGSRGQVRISRGIGDAASRHDPRRAHLLGNRDEVGDQGGGDTGPLQLLGKR